MTAPESWTVTFMRGEPISIWSRWWHRTERWEETGRVTDGPLIRVTYRKAER